VNAWPLLPLLQELPEGGFLLQDQSAFILKFALLINPNPDFLLGLAVLVFPLAIGQGEVPLPEFLIFPIYDRPLVITSPLGHTEPPARRTLDLQNKVAQKLPIVNPPNPVTFALRLSVSKEMRHVGREFGTHFKT
jgi:hypothetical protein